MIQPRRRMMTPNPAGRGGAKKLPAGTTAERDSSQRLRDVPPLVGRVGECNSRLGPGQELDDICRHICQALAVPVAVVTFVSDELDWEVNVVRASGPEANLQASWYDYAILPPRSRGLIVEDTRNDKRFAHNPYIAGQPYIKFCATVALVSKGANWYGNICVVDTKPRTLTPAMRDQLVNCAQRLTLELEHDKGGLREWPRKAIADAVRRASVLVQPWMSPACQDGVLLADTRVRDWAVKRANKTFLESTFHCFNEGTSDWLWAKFSPADQSLEDIIHKAAKGLSFRATLTCKETGVAISAALRPAMIEHLREGVAVGASAVVPDEWGPSSAEASSEDTARCQLRCFYFVILERVGAADPSLRARASGRIDENAGTSYLARDRPPQQGMRVSRSFSNLDALVDEDIVMPSSLRSTVSLTSRHPTQSAARLMALGITESQPRSASPFMCRTASHGDQHLPDELSAITLGSPIGNGSYGIVYSGRWGDDVVAVKRIVCKSDAKLQEVASEGSLGMMLNHPNVVKTLTMSSHESDLERIRLEGADQNGKENGHTVWIIQQYCDAGTLIEAVERGDFQVNQSLQGQPDYLAIYHILHDIASGMAHLHANHLLHMDVHGKNIMLKHCDREGCDVTAMICDFGLARECTGVVQSPDMIGTVTHMAPELLRDGVVSLSGDVWGFGILMWELASARKAYHDKQKGNVMFLVTSGRGQLEAPDHAPETYKDIMSLCLQYAANQRPTFAQLQDMLHAAIRNI